MKSTLIKGLIALCAIGTSLVVSAGEQRWVGGSEGVWGNANNWDPQGVPTSDSILSVAGDAATIDLEGGSGEFSCLTNTAALTLKNGSLTSSFAKSTANVIYNYKGGDLILSNVTVSASAARMRNYENGTTLFTGKIAFNKIDLNFSTYAGQAFAFENADATMAGLTFASGAKGSLIVDNSAVSFTSVGAEKFAVPAVIMLGEKNVTSPAITVKGAFSGSTSTVTVMVDGTDGVFKIFKADSLKAPALTVKKGEATLVEGVDYTLTTTATELSLTMGTPVAPTYTVVWDATIVSVTADGQVVVKGAERPVTGAPETFAWTAAEGYEDGSTTVTAEAKAVIELKAKAKTTKKEIDIPGVVKLTLDTEIFKAAHPDIDVDDMEALKNYLGNEQANGLLGWVNYALGLDDNTLPYVSISAADDDADKIAIAKNFAVLESSGCSLVCTINGEVGEAILLSTLTESAQSFLVKATVYDQASNLQEVTEEYFGANLVAASEEEATLVSVPWAGMVSKSLSINEFLKQATLTEGVTLTVYDAAQDTYFSWRWNGEAWESQLGAIRLGGQQLQAPAAEDYTVVFGQGIWVKSAPGATLVQLGTVSEDTRSQVDAGKWGLMALPLSVSGEKSLTDLFAGTACEGVTIQFEVSDDEVRLYTMKDGVWGYDGFDVQEKTVRGVKTWVSVPKWIPYDDDPVMLLGGQGFWCLNDGDDAVEISWEGQN